MTTPTGDWAAVSDALGAVRAELARLSERVAALEAAAEVKTAPPALVEAEPISEEVLVVISAAIAAFLGKKPSIRQIRLLGTTAWAQQGRVTIQASHALSGRHTRSAH
jgi:methylmalonyl-CoA carboxyltransferase large subunit